MTLPAPLWNAERLAAWRAAVPADLPLPPGDPSTWTCLFVELGLAPLLARDDRGYTEIVNAELLRALARAYGRPVAEDESEALMLVTPLPGGVGLDAKLIELLGHSSYQIRQCAALCLGRRGVEVAKPALLRAVADGDNDVRRGAAEALGRLGDASVAGALVPLLSDGDETVAYAAVTAMLRLGAEEAMAGAVEEERGSEALLGLLRALIRAEEANDYEPLAGVLAESEEGINRIVFEYVSKRPALAAAWVEALVEHLRSSDDTGVGSPSAALSAGGEDALEALGPLLEDDSWQVRLNAVVALGLMPEIGGLGPALAARLGDDDLDVARDASLACLVHGVEVVRAKAKLQSTFSDARGFVDRVLRAASRGVSLGGLEVVAGRGSADVGFLGVLIAEYGGSRPRGLLALAAGAAAPAWAGPIFEAVASGRSGSVDHELRRFAAAGCLMLGRAPADGVLHRLLLCHEGSLSSEPRGLMAGLETRAPALAALAALDPAWPVRIDALRLLLRLGPAADPFRPLIESIALRDADSDCRRVASEGAPRAWRSDDAAERLARVLVRSSFDDDTARAAELGILVREQPEIGVPFAERAMMGDNRELARAAARILATHLPAERVADAVRGAAARLTDSGWVVREVACDFLGAVPPAAVEVGLREELVESLSARADEDDDNDVRVAARAAATRLAGSAT